MGWWGQVSCGGGSLATSKPLRCRHRYGRRCRWCRHAYGLTASIAATAAGAAAAGAAMHTA
eukprot:357104-Chlamydomonas_euryale.AAC.5